MCICHDMYYVTIFYYTIIYRLYVYFYTLLKNVIIADDINYIIYDIYYYMHTIMRFN